MSREEHIHKINSAKAELKTAGPKHKRDLLKHIKRMQREIREYDRFHAEAARG